MLPREGGTLTETLGSHCNAALLRRHLPLWRCRHRKSSPLQDFVAFSGQPDRYKEKQWPGQAFALTLSIWNIYVFLLLTSTLVNSRPKSWMPRVHLPSAFSNCDKWGAVQTQRDGILNNATIHPGPSQYGWNWTCTAEHWKGSTQDLGRLNLKVCL